MNRLYPRLLLFFSLFAATGTCYYYFSSHETNQDSKVLRIAMSQMPAGVYPGGNGVPNSQVLSIFAEAPYGYNDHGVLVPILAEGEPIVEEDNRKMTIKLKQSRFFHDDPCFIEHDGKGRECTAYDLAWTFKSIGDPNNGLNLSATNVQSMGITGYDAWIQQNRNNGTTDYDQPIEGIHVVDDHTLELRFDNPQSATRIKGLLAVDLFAVPHEGYCMYGKEVKRHPIGTGPYMFKGYYAIEEDTQFVFDRNPHYQGLKPACDQIVVFWIREPSVALKMFEMGELDYISLPSSSYEAVTDESGCLLPFYKERGARLLQGPGGHTQYLFMNQRDPEAPLADLTVREALNCSIDRKDLCQTFKGTTLATAIIPPGWEGYESPGTYAACTTEYNPERACALLDAYKAAKGVKGPLYLTLTMAAGMDNRRIGEYLQRTWKEVGIELKIISLDGAYFYSMIKNPSLETEFLLLNELADYHPSSQSFTKIFQGRNIPPDGYNRSWYDNPAYNEHADKTHRELDKKKREGMFCHLNRLLMYDAVIVPLTHKDFFLLAHSWVKGVTAQPMMLGCRILFYVDIDEKARKAYRPS